MTYRFPALVCAFAVAVAGLVVAPAAASAASSGLGPGETLAAGQALTSPDGHYQLVMQGDGNLVLYVAGGRSLWSTQTAGNPGAQAVMQTNGNLAVLDAGGTVLWSANTSGSNCAHLAVQDDGNLVLYGASGAVWSSGTVNSTLQPGEELTSNQSLYSGNDEFQLIMQGDGNLVLYDRAGKALWNAGTEGEGGDRVIMQGDGNLVMYTPAGQALWYTGTSGKSGAYLIVQDDANLVLYLGSTALWNTATEGQSFTRLPAPIATTDAVPGNCGVPLPTPPPPPAPTIVYVPVVIYLPTPRGRHHVKVRLIMSWTWNGADTRLFAVRAKRLPRRARIVVVCRGRGCPDRAHVASAHVKHLLRSLAGQTYRAGDRVYITIRARGDVPERVEVVIRYGREPRAKLL